MDKTFTDQTFTKEHNGHVFEKGEYDHCIFQHRDLQAADFSSSIFIDCTFEHCDISRATLNNTVFRDVQFKGSKLMGIHFENCNKFGLAFMFEQCHLHHSSFYRCSLKKIIFRECELVEVDFAECDLTNAVFDRCNLSGATFDNTLLEKADLTTAYGYSINPEINRIRRAKFSLDGVGGLLDKYDIDISA